MGRPLAVVEDVAKQKVLLNELGEWTSQTKLTKSPRRQGFFGGTPAGSWRFVLPRNSSVPSGRTEDRKAIGQNERPPLGLKLFPPPTCLLGVSVLQKE